MTKLALILFGAPRIERDGTPVTVDTRKAVALLAYLVVTRQPQRRDRLADLLWPEYDQERARATLRRTLSALNAAIAGDWLLVSRETVGLNPHAPIWSDVETFREHLSACPRPQQQPGQVSDECLSSLTEAADLYVDHFMAGFTLRDSPDFDDWQFLQREELQRELAGALEALVAGHSAAGNFDTAIGLARRRLALDRLHEPAHCALMELYSRAGRRAAALQQYRECVHVLDRELGVAPLDSTTRLYEAIKEQRLPLTPGPGSDQPHAAVVAQSSAVSPGRGSVAEHAPASAAARAPERYPLRGRAAEWGALMRAYSTVGTDGRVAILDGEAGIGKTRLAEEFLAHVRMRGATVISGRCYEGEAQLAFGAVGAALRGALAQPVVAGRLDAVPDVWLAEVARLAPELLHRGMKLPPPAELDSPGAQGRFFEGVRSALLDFCGGPGGPPGILFIDDVHWADNASIELLTYLVRRMRDYPLLLLLSWRHDEAAQSRRLRLLLADAQRSEAATVIPLSRLALDDVRELARASGAAGGTPTEELTRRLHHETEGLPLFVVEYLAALANGALSSNERNWVLPGGVRDLLSSRLSAVSETGWQVLTAAAAMGRSFEFETVREVSGRSEEETVAALEELIAHGLVEEVAGRAGALTYDFRHDKTRALVYDDTSLARRRLLHRRIAESLLARSRGARDPGSLAGQIAAHFAAAGNDAEAAAHYKLAGERARTLYAHAEALAHLKSALALGHPQEATLHEAIGDLHTLLGEYRAALTSYEAAAALTDVDQCARLDCKLAGVYARRGEWELSESHIVDALDAWGEDGPAGDRARALADLSLIARHRGRLDQAADLAREALDLATEAGDARALAQAHNVLGMLANGQRQFDQALEHLVRSLSLAERLDDATIRIAALNNLSLVHAARGDAQTARALAETALQLCATHGDRHREAALYNNLADLLRASGDLEGAMAHLKTAVVIFAEIGAEAGTPQPEIWKLTEW